MAERPEAELKVLVLEDEVLIAMDLGMMLEDLGMRVLGPYTTAAEAIGAVDGATPDFALLDYNLNGHTSEDVALRMIDRDVPFAFITGLALRHLPPQLRGAKVVQKPITGTALKGLFAELLPEDSDRG